MDGNKGLKQIKRIRKMLCLFLCILLVVTDFPMIPYREVYHELTGMQDEVEAAPTENPFADSMDAGHLITASEGVNEVVVSDSQVLAIDTLEKLERFSWWYNTYADGSKVYNVSIGITGSSYIDLFHESRFVSIGTEQKPFHGNIGISDGSMRKILADVPFFAYIDQSSNIVDDVNKIQAGTATAQELLFICSRSIFDDMGIAPVFADHVVNKYGSTVPLQCKVTMSAQLVADTEANNYNKDFAGVFGTIEEETSVELEFKNNSLFNGKAANVVMASSNQPVGLFCGEMQENAKLTVTFNTNTDDQHNNDYSVTSGNAPAGGMVGKMNSGSILLISGTEMNAVTQQVTSSGSYAGGIVGYAEDAYIGVAEPVDGIMTITDALRSSKTTLSGNSNKGEGYLFGGFKATTVSGITMSGFTSLELSTAKEKAGGLIGELSYTPAAVAPFVIDGGITVTEGNVPTTPLLAADFGNGKSAGGLVGFYSTNDLKNTLEIKNVYVKISGSSAAETGGIVGQIDDKEVAAYIKLSNVYAQSTGSDKSGGGLIGKAGNTDTKGVFVDVCDFVKVQGGFGGGLIYGIPYGVLRIGGTTDLSELTAGNSIVKDRDTALIYSKGSGADGTWKLIRSNTKLNTDDIGSWGEVLRLTGGLATSSGNESPVVNESELETTHTVSIAGASGQINNLKDFAILALNMQLNTTKSSAALVMGATKSATLLGSTGSITLGCDIDLAGTGLTGLTRDWYNSADVPFQGSFSGENHKITLAVGEAYGVNASGTAYTNADITSTSKCGKIHAHYRSGLFNETKGASFDQLTIDGVCYKKTINNAEDCFGGITAYSHGGDQFTSCTVNAECHTFRENTNARVFLGGFIGILDPKDNTQFMGCTGNAQITDGASSESGNELYYGGYIAYVKTGNGSASIDFSEAAGGNGSCKVGGSYANTQDANYTIYGGLIGAVEVNASHEIGRVINLNKVTVDGLTVDSKVNGSASGGLLGFAWHDVQVNLVDVEIGKETAPEVSIVSGNSTALSGLVYTATGRFEVTKVNFESFGFHGKNANTSLGLLVNNGINSLNLPKMGDPSKDKNAALYLSLADQTKYTINGEQNYAKDSQTKERITNVSVFDELVAYSKHPDRSILDNGHAIVSINTDGSGSAVKMDDSGCNTYQNQSYFGKNTVKSNANTRYYYNLGAILNNNAKTDAQKLLLWSVSQYANGNAIKSIFQDDSYTTISGNLDMKGLSYYPINYVAIGIGEISKLKFYNAEIERAESLSGDTDAFMRSTLSEDTQHYTMHCGLFRKASGSNTNGLKVSLNGNITISGNVGAINGNSGFLFCESLAGSDYATSFSNGTHSILLDGAYINGGEGSIGPMLINKVGKNAIISVNGVSTSNYTSLQSEGWYAATSLIGGVGETNGSSSNMKVNFSNITLDSRKAESMPSRTSAPTGSADIERFNAVYGSKRSIFSVATLLQHYYFDKNTDSSSSGSYNYTWSEDWGQDNNGKTKHAVTYGQEITYSVENAGKQDKYFGDARYTDPVNNAVTANPYSFAKASFLPYVGNYDNSNENYHELEVNISSVDLTDGCGTYDDPYVVNAMQLIAVAKIIGSSDIQSSKVCLPGNLPTSIPTNVSQITDINLLWHGDKGHDIYDVDSNNKEYTNGNKTYSLDAVRTYLAGAYYKITDDLTLTSDFIGLGGESAQYAFRGIVIGEEKNGVYPTIEIEGNTPLINTSNGSVVKNLNISVKNLNYTMSTDYAVANAKFQYNGGCSSYGAVMGKIMGGDNVIDHVEVTINGSISAGATAKNPHIVPVGGYVGVVVNGGLFFRNMEGVSHDGLTSANFSEIDSMKYLYVNPIIGRVINGYAVYESDSFGGNTLDNGTKNYPIVDLNKNEESMLKVENGKITVPNAQAWFVMSLIVNSGTGNSNNWIPNGISYTQSLCRTNHIGVYDNVGKEGITKTVATDAVWQSNYAEIANNKYRMPYIIYHYTVQPSSNPFQNYAKTLTSSSTPFSITLATNGNWELPDSYRGIGGLNSKDNGNTNNNYGYTLLLSGLEGNHTKIKLNMNYYTYSYSTASKFPSYDNYPVDTSNGFGLFNKLNPAAKCVIQNLTLTGSVLLESLETDGSRHPIGKASGGNDSSSATKSYACAGMLAGYRDNSNAFTVNNVNLEGIDVRSMHSAGGLIGYLKGTGKATVSNCQVTDIYVKSAINVGGIIGFDGSPLLIDGGEDGTWVTIDQILIEGGINSWKDQGSGGIVGMTSNSDVVIRGLNISKAKGKSGKISYIKNSEGKIYADYTSYKGQGKQNAGSIVGQDRSMLTVRDCNVYGVSVDGFRTGGAIGSYYLDQSFSAVPLLDNVHLYGKQYYDMDTKSFVELPEKATLYNGWNSNDRNVGGLIGVVIFKKIQMNNCSIKDYEIKGEGTIGGCIGYLHENGHVNMSNILITDLHFSGKHICASVCIGKIESKSNPKLMGYNIAVKDITASCNMDADFVGLREGSDSPIQIVGFSRQNTPATTSAAPINSSVDANKNDYIIYADYVAANGFEEEDGCNTAKSMIEGMGDFYMVDAYKPFATVNPFLSFGGNTILTGDGISASLDEDKLPVKIIMSDIADANNKKRYTVVTDAKTEFTPYVNNLVSFKAQWGDAYTGQDFVVLQLEDTDTERSTTMINSYLKLLMNYNQDLSIPQNDIYTVNIYKMKWDASNEKFVNDGTANANLVNLNDKFYMKSPKNVDSAEEVPTFSLIDVAFKDPTGGSAYVYHLYLPVFVKKMLPFKFDIAVAAGTSYRSADYDMNGSMLMQNLGSPGTLYFSYTYHRTRKEWQEAIDNGENLLTNYDKILSMIKISGTHLQDDTILTLVDVNDKGKAYYARFGQAYDAAKEQLILYQSGSTAGNTFHRHLDAADSDAFKPLNLNEFLNLKATASAAGSFIAVNPDDEDDLAKATVMVGEAYYRPAESTDAQLQHYVVTVVNLAGNSESVADSEYIDIVESYYLSIFSEKSADNIMNYYDITSPERLMGGYAPAKAENKIRDIKDKQVLFGNLFIQTPVTIQADYDGSNPNEITVSNDTVKAKLSTTIKLAPGMEEQFATQFTNASFYQSFLVYLTKHDESGDKRGIYGNPNAQAGFTISSVGQHETQKNIALSGDYAQCNLDYVEVASKENLNRFIKDGGAVVVAYVHLEYDGIEKQMEQFPIRTKNDNSEEGKYAELSATSHIAFDVNQTALSKNLTKASIVGNVRHYYIKINSNPELLYNAVVDEDGQRYGRLGINAREASASSGWVDVLTEAKYDVSNVENQVSECQYVRITFDLREKKTGTLYEYGEALKLTDDYLSDVMSDTVAGSLSADGKTYSIVLRRADVAEADNLSVMTIPISFKVMTGAPFEAKGHQYSNYRITIKAEMLVNEGDAKGIEASIASNYLIYTNAKLINEFIR